MKSNIDILSALVSHLRETCRGTLIYRQNRLYLMLLPK
jgi:hypothetical protein